MKIKQLQVKDWKKQLANADPQDHLHLYWNTYSDGGESCRRVRYDEDLQAVVIEQSNSGRGPTVEKLLQLLDSVPDSTPIYAHWEENEGAFYVIRKLKGTGVELDGGLEWGPPDPEDEEYGEDIDDGKPDKKSYGVDAQGRAILPEGVTEIEDEAFRCRKDLKSIVIPEGVTTIGWKAFQGCSSLISVKFPASLQRIGGCAFWGCTLQPSLVIPEGLTYIGDNAFHYCEGLKSITLPDSVTYIGDWAFDECTNLVSASVPANCEIDSDAFPEQTKVIRRDERARVRESTKVTLTLGQLKKLVKESAEAAESLKDVAAFASKAMFFSVLVHFWHLNCGSNAQHLALKDLYESLDDNADKLLEAVIGQTGESVKITNPGFEFKGEFTEEAIGQIKAIKDEASKLEATVESNPGIANVLADIVEDCDSAIYKLKRLK